MEKIALTVKETAEVLGVSKDVIYWMVYRKVLPHNRTQGRGKKGKILIPKKASEVSQIKK
ncbi:MAG TPA: helix-turn-helix domain-containing protein [Thermoanaerobacter sp.]|nr:helix-turn-helix domain-containing protein [Thermoanaerobacter sp.]